MRVIFPPLAEPIGMVVLQSRKRMRNILAHLGTRTNRLISTLLFLMHVAPVFALAGIGESSSQFHYNDFVFIERGHPSDLCDGPTKWCLSLYREDYRRFPGVDSSFEEINVPQNRTNPYFIGRRSLDGYWVIYDLKQEQVVTTNTDHDVVIAKWRSLGLAEPTYVNAHNTRERLIETEDSVFSRWSTGLQMWLFFGVLPLSLVALIFWYLSRKAKIQYKKNDSKIMLVFSYVFLVPVFLVIYASASSLVQIILHNW